MDQKNLYELQFSSHTNIITPPPAGIYARNQFVINFINNFIALVENNNLSIVELSIGDGSLSRNLISSFENINLTCVDICPNLIHLNKYAIETAGFNFKSRVDFIECNFDTQFTAVASDKFEVAIALDIMEHVFDVFGFIENCHRILTTGGILFLRVPNIGYIKHRIGLMCGNLPITASWFGTKGDLTNWQHRYGWDGGHLHYFTLPLLYQLLKNYGFEIEECRDPGTKFSSLRNLFPELLYSNPLIVAKKK